MRALPRTLAITFLGLFLFSGCNEGSDLGGNSEATGDSADQKQFAAAKVAQWRPASAC